MRQTRGIVSKIRADVRQVLWPQKSELTADNNYCFKSQHGKHVILTWTSALSQTQRTAAQVQADDTQELLKSTLTTHKNYGNQRWRHTRVMEVNADDTWELWKSPLTTDKRYGYAIQRWQQIRVIVTKVSVDGRHEVWSLTRGIYGHERQCWRQTRGMVMNFSADDRH